MILWKEYRVARLFGWTPDEIDGVSGQWLDWALKIERLDRG